MASGRFGPFLNAPAELRARGSRQDPVDALRLDLKLPQSQRPLQDIELRQRDDMNGVASLSVRLAPTSGPSAQIQDDLFPVGLVNAFCG